MSTTIKTDSVWFTTKGQVVIPVWLRRQFGIEVERVRILRQPRFRRVRTRCFTRLASARRRLWGMARSSVHA